MSILKQLKRNINKEKNDKNRGWVSKLQAGAIRQRRTHSCLTLPSTRGYTIFPSSTEECRKKYTFPTLPSTRENTLFAQWYQGEKHLFLFRIINNKGIHTFPITYQQMPRHTEKYLFLENSKIASWKRAGRSCSDPTILL